MVRLGCDALVNDFVLSLLSKQYRVSHAGGAKHDSIKRTFSPCCFSNLYHHAHRSPLSGSAFAARLSHSLVFSILRSFQKRRPTALITRGCSFDFLIASTERPFLCRAASIQIAMLQSRPEAGQSCCAAKLYHGHISISTVQLCNLDSTHLWPAWPSPDLHFLPVLPL